MERADVLILGGGLVGLSLAIALSRNGVTSIVVDAAEPASQIAPAFDGRATAVSSSSWRMLQAIGVGERIEGHGCPIRAIRVSDGLAPGNLPFDPGRGSLGEGDEEPLGIMFENRLLRQALQQTAAESEHITLIAPARTGEVVRDETGVRAALTDGRAVMASLLIGAEGRNSPTRDAAHIPLARWQYDHAAMVTTVRHERPHENVAYEIFYPAGPFAILPMLDDEQGHRSAIVWSVSAADGPAYMGLSDRAFAAEIEKRMGGFLGRVEMGSRRWTYPLGFHHAAQITDLRLALVGDAAHGIHPIAGQGLNLGFRDGAALAQVLVEGARLGLDLGDAQLLDRYQRWRSLDAFSVALATDSLTRIYGVPGRTASAVRRFGMGLIDRIAPLKDRLMAEARGTSGELPLLLRGLPI
ncbi:MAG TPA: UbiH/UbiF/VisC/COQ6 family ubiquinone biosynthesis hydroxylase [Allosphingosinicella sp.]